MEDQNESWIEPWIEPSIDELNRAPLFSPPSDQQPSCSLTHFRQRFPVSILDGGDQILLSLAILGRQVLGVLEVAHEDLLRLDGVAALEDQNRLHEVRLVQRREHLVLVQHGFVPVEEAATQNAT